VWCEVAEGEKGLKVRGRCAKGVWQVCLRKVRQWQWASMVKGVSSGTRHAVGQAGISPKLSQPEGVVGHGQELEKAQHPWKGGHAGSSRSLRAWELAEGEVGWEEGRLGMNDRRQEEGGMEGVSSG